ncbi:MAG: hypothetical protein ABEJ05_10120, partial [Haloglomus sp.]
GPAEMTPTSAAASGDSGDSSGGGEGDGGEPPARTFDGWLADTDNYDGVVDERGAEEVTVKVDAEGNGGPFGSEPAAVHVSPGTRVVWERVGPKEYNVRARDRGLESKTIASSEDTYAAEVDSDGLAKHTCSRYGDRGMRGVILVGEGPVRELTARDAAGAGGLGALVVGSLGRLWRFNDGAATTTDPADVRRG